MPIIHDPVQDQTNLTTPLPIAALVTGGATRLGFEFAKALALRGHDIALHYCHAKQEAQAAQKKIVAMGVACELFKADLSGPNPQQLIHEVVQYFPRLQVLVNSASAYEAASIKNTTMDLLLQQFSVNFFSPFLLTQAFVNNCESGAVVNIIDNKIRFEQYNYAAYLLSKRSLAEFTRLAAVEYAPKFRINGIAPGLVMPGVQRTSDYIDWRVAAIPLNRQGQVKHLLLGLNYLLDNQFVTGQILTIDGGENINQTGRHAENYQP